MNGGLLGFPLGQGVLPMGLVKIDDQYIRAPQATAQFDLVVPPEFAHLLIVASLRSDQAANESNARLRLNDDSGSNYQNQIGVSQGGSMFTSVGATDTQLTFGNVAGGNDRAHQYGSVLGLVLNYRSTHYKNIIVVTYDWNSPSSNGTAFFGGGTWANTDPVTKLSVFSSSGNLVEDSRVSLYGLA